MVLCFTLLAGWSHSFVLFHQQLRWCNRRLKNKDPRVRCIWVWTKAPPLASCVILGKCLASLALSCLTCKVRIIKLTHWTALGIKWGVCMCVKPIAQCLVWSKCWINGSQCHGMYSALHWDTYQLNNCFFPRISFCGESLCYDYFLFCVVLYTSEKRDQGDT